jgi:hypothetical protein
MAMITRDSAFHKTMLYNENFLNTAVMPKSVYNWAKMFNVNVTAATPAYAEIELKISLDNIGNYSRTYDSISGAKYGTEVTGNPLRQFLILDRSNSMIAGDFVFTMERSVLIYELSSGVYVTKYCQTEINDTTTYQNLDGFFLNNQVRSDETGTQFLVFSVRAYQYQVTRQTRQISSSSFLDSKIHKFNFPDQFAGAKLSYKKGTTAEESVDLLFTTINQEDTGNKFAYYNLVSTNTLQITFSSSQGGFVPAVNSVIYLDVFTTKGAAGNISFTGDVIFRLSEESLKNLPIMANFRDGLSVGGVNAPTLSQIKNTVINEISTRDVIVTESDINSYFLILTALLETVNDGKIEFIKKRDDILRRVFTSSILMRDGLDVDDNIPTQSGYTSKVIPTNTITADFTIDENVSKPFGSIIKRKSDDALGYENVLSNELGGETDYYIIPFYTRVTLDPFRKVKYIYNLTDDSSRLNYRDLTLVVGDNYMIPSTVTLTRGLSGMVTQDFYTLSFNFTTNIDSNSFASDDQFVVSFFRRGNDTTAIKTSTFRPIDGNVSFVSTLNEDGTFALSVRINLETEAGVDEFNFSQDDYGTFIRLKNGEDLINLPEDVRVVLAVKSPILNQISFVSGDFLSLFRNLDELMFSDIQVNTATSGSPAVTAITSITIKDIPVVHQSFFDSEASQTKFIKQLFVYIDLLRENLGRLESNTFFDLKFFNTYGDARYYNTSRTDLNLELDVYVVEKTDQLESSIRDFIRLLVDNSNANSELKVSEIIKATLNEFGDTTIDHIDFKGLNGTLQQYVTKIPTVQDNLYAPEYLNISKENLVSIRVIQI